MTESSQKALAKRLQTLELKLNSFSSAVASAQHNQAHIYDDDVVFIQRIRNIGKEGLLSPPCLGSIKTQRLTHAFIQILYMYICMNL